MKYQDHPAARLLAGAGHIALQLRKVRVAHHIRERAECVGVRRRDDLRTRRYRPGIGIPTLAHHGLGLLAIAPERVGKGLGRKAVVHQILSVVTYLVAEFASAKIPDIDVIEPMPADLVPVVLQHMQLFPGQVGRSSNQPARDVPGGLQSILFQDGRDSVVVGVAVIKR